MPLENGRYLMDRVGSSEATLVTLNDSAHLPTLDYDKERVHVECMSFIGRLVNGRSAVKVKS